MLSSVTCACQVTVRSVRVSRAYNEEQQKETLKEPDPELLLELDLEQVTSGGDAGGDDDDDNNDDKVFWLAGLSYLEPARRRA